MIGRLAAGLIALGLVVTAPARAAEQSIQAALAELQHDDARLQSIGWRLAVGSARFCPDARPAIGLLLQDMQNYTQPGQVRAAAGIRGDIAVQAVAEGSPAALAGLLPNEEILAIDGQKVSTIPDPKPRDHRRLYALLDRIDEGLKRSGMILLQVRATDGAVRELLIEGVPACPGRFVLLTGNAKAEASQGNVFIGERFADNGRPGDALGDEEYAAMVAHELAHLLLRHGAWLDKAGRDPQMIRQTEREADRLAIWLLVNAGFDPEAGPRLMGSWGRRSNSGLRLRSTHDGWRARLELMSQEVRRVRTILKERGAADWSRDFIRAT